MMLAELADILVNIEIEKDNAPLLELRKKVLNTPVAGAQNLIDELKDKERLCTDLQPHNDLPFICAFLAYAYRLSGNINDITEGTKHAAKAVDQFRICGSPWNETMAHWFLGLLYRDDGFQDLCGVELKNAVIIVERLSKNARIEGHYLYYQNSQNILDQLYHCIHGTEDCLLLSRLPVIDQYLKVTKEGVKPVIRPKRDRTTVQQVILDAHPYIIRVVKKIAPTDHQVVFIEGKCYGWAEVQEKSMNLFDPPIEDGDFVLFYLQNNADENDVVIACRPKANQEEIPYIIRQYINKNSANEALHSVTAGKGGGYKDVPKGEFHIIGIVVAVAKPIRKQEV